MFFLPAWKHRWIAPALCAGCALAALLAYAPVAAAGSRKSEMKAQGAALFADKGCSHCHGAAGFGGSDSGPDLSQVRKELKPAEIAQQIHDGGKNMPAFGDSLSSDEIAELVQYLRSRRKPPPGFQRRAITPPAPASPAAKPDPD
jgi:mono/diheme cytochrome c family protein